MLTLGELKELGDAIRLLDLEDRILLTLLSARVEGTVEEYFTGREVEEMVREIFPNVGWRRSGRWETYFESRFYPEYEVAMVKPFGIPTYRLSNTGVSRAMRKARDIGGESGGTRQTRL